MVWLPDRKKWTFIAVSTEYRRMTDGQTDILRQHNPRCACINDRNKNYCLIKIIFYSCIIKWQIFGVFIEKQKY